MVNIEDLSAEDQRKYTELHEYIKQQFLSSARKDRSDKVTMTQDFEMPAIKINNDKIEVITTVSKSETELSMKSTEISDKFKHAFSNQHSQVARIIPRLEKIEGKSSSSSFSNDSIPQMDSKGDCK
jgi:putative cell wall-binding protein